VLQKPNQKFFYAIKENAKIDFFHLPCSCVAEEIFVFNKVLTVAECREIKPW
jgi:hypothetical protein